MFQSGGPKRGVNGGGPAMRSVQESGASIEGDVFDAVLGTAVLMMSVDAAKRKGLVGSGDGGFEGGRVKKAIVGVVVPNVNSVRRAEALKGCFGGDSGGGSQFGH